jgi:hypothetical protein
MPLVKVNNSLYIATEHIIAIEFRNSQGKPYAYIWTVNYWTNTSQAREVDAEVGHYITRIMDADEGFVSSAEIAQAAADVPLTTRIAQALKSDYPEGITLNWHRFQLTEQDRSVQQIQLSKEL